MLETLARTAKALGAVAFVVAILAFFGAAYCEYDMRQSPSRPDIAGGRVNAIDYKGEKRYVGRLDTEICTTSLPLIFGAAALGMLLNGFYIYVFRRFP